MRIPGYPVLTSSKFRVDPSFPSPSLCDHVLTAIPRGDSFLFLDTTPEVAPFGMLIASLRDRQALVIPASALARLVTTPADPPFGSVQHFKMDSLLDAKGTLDGKMRLELRGDSELVFRLTYRSTPQNRWQELTQNIIARMGFGGTVSDVSVSQPEDTAQPFSVSCSYHRTDFSDWKNHRITLPSPPALIASLTEEQKLSKDPLPLGELSEVTHEATIKLPPDFSAVVPPNVSRKTEFAEYTANYSFKESILHGIINLNTLLREVPAEKRHKFTSLSTTISDTESRYILITGKFPDGGSFSANLMGLDPSKPEGMIPSLEKALADNPDNRMVLFPLSQAYTRAGRPKDAIAILEKALAETPEDSGGLYFALGQAYLAVPDADKAMANYQKALRNDPQSPLLNSIAYSLAEANVHLKEALEYSTRAVTSLSEETMDISSESAQPRDYALMGQLAANWATPRCTKFRLPDLPSASKYI